MNTEKQKPEEAWLWSCGYRQSKVKKEQKDKHMSHTRKKKSLALKIYAMREKKMEANFLKEKINPFLINHKT